MPERHWPYSTTIMSKHGTASWTHTRTLEHLDTFPATLLSGRLIKQFLLGIHHCGAHHRLPW